MKARRRSTDPWFGGHRLGVKHGGRNLGERGVALLFVILLVVVVSILGGAAALAWIRYHDFAAREDEKAALARIDQLFRGQVMEAAAIPAPTNLLSVVAAVAGESLDRTVDNPRGNERVVLADPGLTLGPLGLSKLPYSQTMAASIAPRNPRLLLLSSAGSPLPADLVSGTTLGAGQFSNLWSAAQGRAPVDWDWNGNPADLCFQRISFGDLFVELTLRYYEDEPQHRGMYTLDNQHALTSLPALLPNGADSFAPFIVRGTYLSLYGANGVLQFRDIIRDNAIVYTCRNGIWYRGFGRIGSRVGAVIRHPTPEQFVDGLAAFLDPGIPLWPQNTTTSKDEMEAAILNFLALGVSDNQSSAMSVAQETLIDAWVEFNGATPNAP